MRDLINEALSFIICGAITGWMFFLMLEEAVR